MGNKLVGEITLRGNTLRGITLWEEYFAGVLTRASLGIPMVDSAGDRKNFVEDDFFRGY